MANLFRQTGGTTTLLPNISWAAPNGMFSANQRNDGSSYSFTPSTSAVTLPSSGLADGYLLVARFEFLDTSNGRHNPQGKIVQTEGTGNFIGAPTGGYNRNNNNNKAFVSCFAVVDSPSASSTFQFQWKRDTDTPIGGTTRSSFDVIPLYYSDIGMYTSNSSLLYGGTTPNQVVLTSTILEGSNITRSGNIVTVSGDNKRYLVLSSQFYEGRGGRTQRWFGHNYDGTQDRSAMACVYIRNVANDETGGHITDVIETQTANRTIELNCYRGDGNLANEGGANIDGNTPTVGDHSLVVIELNDSAETIRSNSTGAASQNIDLGEAISVDISGVNTVDFNDSTSFTKVSATAINIEQNMDVLVGANISGASRAVGSGTRYTGKSAPTVNGIEESDIFHGNYMRGNQSTTDTFGFSSNHVGFIAVSVGDDIGNSVVEDGDNGDATVQSGWSGFWALNLDTLENTVLTTRRRVFNIT